MTKLFKRAFWYNREVLECGTPKVDILIQKNTDLEFLAKTKAAIGISKRKKVLLYAPTFRKNGGFDAYNIDYTKLQNTLKEKFGGDWVILVRLHPNISLESLDLGKKDIIDMSRYPDIQELMLISDICITDYSSVMFEFSYMKRPVFLFASDIDEYVDDRGFYFDLKSLPYPLAVNNNALVKNIMNFSNKEYLKSLKDFFEEIDLNENGTSSRIVAERIESIIKDGK